MLSLTNSIRHAASTARPLWRQPLRISAFIETRRHNSSDVSLGDVTDHLMSKGNAPLAPAPTGNSREGGLNYDEVEFKQRGFHFQRSQFLSPNQLSHKSLTKEKTARKKPALGPSRIESRRLDMFHQLQIDPLKEAMNSRLMSDFVTQMGKIKSRSETKLTWRSQRRLGKAIRRAKMMGIIPVLSKRMLTRDDRDF
ncbi:hypothetical protein DAEQUDRAFT_701472 [Daedalea quercina L-15889]|uniref:Small ribosomal subunit protein bS18m n=1 Tax=Daedalea quercina L-15889 TaxID=1314783 RepID=A0A165U214_9APHY|nr:hypothetical protein DAEQUDRAFT_701472 [Daedalea quercina L-15889]